MSKTTIKDALRLEESKWNNWLAAAEKMRDQQLTALAAKSARDGNFQSGGRLKGDLKIVFGAIDEVVLQAVALRKQLCSNNPVLGIEENLSPLRAKIETFTNAAVGYLEARASQTVPGLDAEARRALLNLARAEAKTILDRTKNDLDQILLELKLMEPISFMGIVRAGIGAVPAVKYALGVAGIIAAAALVKQAFASPQEAFMVGAGMFILMVLLVVFSAATKLAPKYLQDAAKILVWAMLILFIGSCFLIASSIFILWPRPFPELGKTPSPPVLPDAGAQWKAPANCSVSDPITKTCSRCDFSAELFRDFNSVLAGKEEVYSCSEMPQGPITAHFDGSIIAQRPIGVASYVRLALQAKSGDNDTDFGNNSTKTKNFQDRRDDNADVKFDLRASGTAGPSRIGTARLKLWTCSSNENTQTQNGAAKCSVNQSAVLSICSGDVCR